MSQKDLDQITDTVLAYKQQDLPLKVIAGAPDRPLVIGEIEFPCYVLEDETRVLSQRGLQSGLGMGTGGGSVAGARRINEFVANLNEKGIDISNLTARINALIEFRSPTGGRTIYGYPAEMLVDLCKLILVARDAGVLQKRQEHFAKRADLLIRGLATVGIIALVDEATGYQQVREQRALATILERLIAKELNPLTRTFPFEFYEQICRLKKWPSIRAIKRPSLMGLYTNQYVYDRLAPGVLEELQRVNPVDSDTGHRKHRHHQWFTHDVGHPKLRGHLEGVIAIMRTCNTWDTFKRRMDIAYPKQGATIPLNLEEED